jgi:hypothetical protein
MRGDDEINEVVMETLMKALVEEERLPRERVERALGRFQDAMRQHASGPASQRLQNERGNGRKKSR